MLRGGALIVLSEVDEQVARYFATRLLADGYTERMSGEPALTAVQVLATQEEWLPIYFCAVQSANGAPAEVVADCLRQLTAGAFSLWCRNSSSSLAKARICLRSSGYSTCFCSTVWPAGSWTSWRTSCKRRMTWICIAICVW